MTHYSVSGPWLVVERHGLRWLVPAAWVEAQEQQVVNDAEAIITAYLAKEGSCGMESSQSDCG